MGEKLTHSLAVFEAAYPDPDCGCPVEDWICNGVSLSIHFEPDGEMEAFADTRDWDCSVPLRAATMEAAREEAFAWACALPSEDEVADSGKAVTPSDTSDAQLGPGRPS